MKPASPAAAARWTWALLAALLCASCAHGGRRATPAGAGAPASQDSGGQSSEPAPRDAGLLGEGLASYYGGSLRGHLTASGERFNPDAFTAAHRSLPFGTCLRVQDVETSRSVQVRVNDRGPYVSGRILDLSEAAARRLGFLRQGVARVRLFRCSRRDLVK